MIALDRHSREGGHLFTDLVSAYPALDFQAGAEKLDSRLRGNDEPKNQGNRK
jgi:hypothetical protein